MGSVIGNNRYYTVYTNKTLSECITDKVEFPPEHNKIPVISNQEEATNAALNLIEDISNPESEAPFASIRATKIQSIR